MKQVEERYISLLTDFGFKRFFGTDIKNSVDTAKREGIAEGITQRNFEIARKMLAKGMDEASIMDMTGLTAEEIKLLKAEILMTNITI